MSRQKSLKKLPLVANRQINDSRLQKKNPKNVFADLYKLLEKYALSLANYSISDL